jgi:hypothetical protein
MRPVRLDSEHESALRKLVDSQAGIVSRSQMHDLGIATNFVRAELRARRWQRVHPGVIATFTGPLADLARVWAAVLYAGDDAVACRDTAAWLWELRSDVSLPITVCIPHGCQTVPSRPDIRILQSRRLAERTHPARMPPCTTLEDTVLDLVYVAGSEHRVIDLVLFACQQRLTTPSKLAARAAARHRLRWRSLLEGLLLDVSDGVASPLERYYARNVERAHGLPHGERNHAEGSAGRRRYRDVRYPRWGLVVELDGAAAHPTDRRELDDLRDNEVTARCERTLRYGWRSVTGTSCAVAEQVSDLLRQGGWTGRPNACGPRCRVDVGVTDAFLATG